MKERAAGNGIRLLLPLEKRADRSRRKINNGRESASKGHQD